MHCKSVRSLRSGKLFIASGTPGDLTWLEDFLTSKWRGDTTAFHISITIAGRFKGFFSQPLNVVTFPSAVHACQAVLHLELKETRASVDTMSTFFILKLFKSLQNCVLKSHPPSIDLPNLGQEGVRGRNIAYTVWKVWGGGSSCSERADPVHEVRGKVQRGSV